MSLFNKRSLLLIIPVFFLTSCFKEKRSDKKGAAMQNFVIEISQYARGLKPGFIVIPQNGPELAFKDLDITEGSMSTYMDAIDGLGIEELFYNGTYAPDDERLAMLRELTAQKKIMVAEYVTNDADVQDAIQRNADEGFLCFPRTGNNYDYMFIPDSAIGSHSGDINSIHDAKNYLYLISTDQFSTKEAMLDSIAATNFDVVLIDLFFNGVALTFNEVQQLKVKQNGGKRLVISYMNIGSAENYRYYWQSKWKLHHPGWLKKAYEGYEDEIWVKFWKQEWQDIIYGNDDSYTKKIVDAGFDGIYMDNVEAYYFLYFD